MAKRRSVRASISNRPSSGPRKNKRPPKAKSHTLSFNEKKLIVYRRPKGLTEQDFSVFLRRAAQDILSRFQISTVVIGVEKWSDIKILDPAEIRDIGFVHIDDVFLLKKDVDLDQYTEQELRDIMSLYVLAEDEKDLDEEE